MRRIIFLLLTRTLFALECKNYQTMHKETCCGKGPDAEAPGVVFSRTTSNANHHIDLFNKWKVDCRAAQDRRLGKGFFDRLLDRKECVVRREFPAELSYQAGFFTYFWLYPDGSIEFQHGEYAFDPAVRSGLLTGAIDRMNRTLFPNPSAVGNINLEEVWSVDLVKNDIFAAMPHMHDPSLRYSHIEFARDREEDPSFDPPDSYFDNLVVFVTREPQNSWGFETNWYVIIVPDLKTPGVFGYNSFMAIDCPPESVYSQPGFEWAKPAVPYHRRREMNTTQGAWGENYAQMFYWGNKRLCWNSISNNIKAGGNHADTPDPLLGLPSPRFENAHTRSPLSLLREFIAQNSDAKGGFQNYYSSIGT